jgi:hypothetical protein
MLLKSIEANLPLFTKNDPVASEKLDLHIRESGLLSPGLFGLWSSPNSASKRNGL